GLAARTDFFQIVANRPMPRGKHLLPPKHQTASALPLKSVGYSGLAPLCRSALNSPHRTSE
ncbi:MAG: hypothetical protein ACK5AM_09635, partial [Pirellulaceae bacterium]